LSIVSAANSALGFIDHQPRVAFSVHSIDLDVLTSNSLL